MTARMPPEQYLVDCLSGHNIMAVPVGTPLDVIRGYGSDVCVYQAVGGRTLETMEGQVDVSRSFRLVPYPRDITRYADAESLRLRILKCLMGGDRLVQADAPIDDYAQDIDAHRRIQPVEIEA